MSSSAAVAATPAVLRMTSRPWSLAIERRSSGYVPVVFLGTRLQLRHCDVVLVEKPLVVDDDAAFAEVVQILGQRFELLVPVVRFFLRIPCEGVSEGKKEIVAVAARPDVFLARAYLYVGVAAPDARGIVSMSEYVRSRAHQGPLQSSDSSSRSVTGTARDSPD